MYFNNILNEYFHVTFKSLLRELYFTDCMKSCSALFDSSAETELRLLQNVNMNVKLSGLLHNMESAVSPSNVSSGEQIFYYFRVDSRIMHPSARRPLSARLNSLDFFFNSFVKPAIFSSSFFSPLSFVLLEHLVTLFCKVSVE